VAGSAYSEDTRALPLGGDTDLAFPPLLESLFSPNTSSRVDVAGMAGLRITPSRLGSVLVKARYVGPGYRSLGAREVEADVLDVVVNPTLAVGGLDVSMSIGRRRNDLAGTRLMQTQRTVVEGSVNYFPDGAFGVSAQFANHGMAAPSRNDTLNVSTVTRLLSVSPMVRFGDRLTHDVQLNYTFSGFADRNRVVQGMADNILHAGRLTHTLGLPGGTTLSTGGSVTFISSRLGGSTSATLSESVGVVFLEERVRLTGTVLYSLTAATALDRGVDAGLRLGVRVRERDQLQLSTQFRRFDVATGAPGGRSFSEVMARVGYSMSF
jgi:hypothetical protein